MPSQKAMMPTVAVGAERRLEDHILGIEAGEADAVAHDERDADADSARVPIHISDEGLRRLLLHAAHLAHVLLVGAWQWMTEPEPRNSSALKKAWVIRWNIAAE